MTTTHKHWTLFWLAWAAWLALSVAAARADVIRLTFDSSTTEWQQDQCRRVETLYNRLVLDRGLIEPYNTMTVSVTAPSIDGRWNIFAQTYASTWIYNSRNKAVLESYARVQFDGDDLPFWSTETLTEVLFHELLHCFGFQETIWYYNGCLPGLVFDGFNTYHDGKYTGPLALAAYQQEHDAAALFMPVDGSHFAQPLSPWIGTPWLTGSYVPRTLLKVLEDNGNLVDPNFQGGLLKDLLPRRVRRPL